MQRFGPDATRYRLAAVGVPVPRPFHIRWLLPKVLGDELPAWRFVWLTSWFDPTALMMVLQTVQGVLGNFFSVLPTMGMVLAWLVPAIWITWGIGMLILLGAVLAGTGILQSIQKS